MKDKDENNIEVSTLLDIIYELFKEDVKRGKLKEDLFKGRKQVVVKPAT